MDVCAWARISPASMRSASVMMLTPVSLSPRRIAQLIGPAPRYLGSREEWTLIASFVGISTSSRPIFCPQAMTTSTSGRRSAILADHFGRR